MNTIVTSSRKMLWQILARLIPRPKLRALGYEYAFRPESLEAFQLVADIGPAPRYFRLEFHPFMHADECQAGEPWSVSGDEVRRRALGEEGEAAGQAIAEVIMRNPDELRALIGSGRATGLIMRDVDREQTMPRTILFPATVWQHKDGTQFVLAIICPGTRRQRLVFISLNQQFCGPGCCTAHFRAR
ncbi:MAG: hypothetical protein PHV78_01490 [Patescibacteria group bacterium]|nr:hypothetical protein [Patescibacteria group bacterium]MDD5121173.1 hypothetical protein [Patescibacteria group bacterium]MDD5222017.1 hypothetical protein [Patescibacteria group bacterium]MDD5395908.1 hypothetical protein [Patescibacteria group bacterium]